MKTDRCSARTLAEACQLGAYRRAHWLSDAHRGTCWCATCTRYIALAKALVRHDGLQVAGSESEQVAERIVALKLSASLTGELTPLFVILAPLNVERSWPPTADRRIAELMVADPIVTLLTTTPGIGPITASVLVAAIDHITCFRSAYDFEAYLGVVLGERSLDKKQPVGRITKAGNAHPRWLLVEVAW